MVDAGRPAEEAGPPSVTISLNRDEYHALNHFYSYGATRGNHSWTKEGGEGSGPSPGPLTPYIAMMGELNSRIAHAFYMLGSPQGAAGATPELIRGIEDAKAGRLQDLGSFAEFADDWDGSTALVEEMLKPFIARIAELEAQLAASVPQGAPPTEPDAWAVYFTGEPKPVSFSGSEPAHLLNRKGIEVVPLYRSPVSSSPPGGTTDTDAVTVTISRDEFMALNSFYSYGATRGNHSGEPVLGPSPGLLTPFIAAMSELNHRISHAFYMRSALSAPSQPGQRP